MRSAIVLCLIAACGGSSRRNYDCRATTDCDDGFECSGVDDPLVCGVPAREECASDDDCSGGSVCHAINESCSPDGVGSECRPPCATSADCDVTLACNAGHCVPILCTAAFECAAREECDPDRIPANAPVFERHHGCFAVACTVDAECGERFCVNGTCQDDVGDCLVPMPVP